MVEMTSKSIAKNQVQCKSLNKYKVMQGQILGDFENFLVCRDVILDSMRIAVSRVKLLDTSDASKVVEVRKLTLHPSYTDDLNNDIGHFFPTII